MLRYSLLCGGCIGIGLVVYFVLVFNRFDDAYAQWGAAEIVIDHMEHHDGDWPTDWMDLQPYFKGGRVSGWSYEEFQRHVWIDFTADSKELRRLSQNSETPPFNVIDSTSLFGSQFEDGPNGMLLRYFNPDAPHPASSMPPPPSPTPMVEPTK